MNNSYRSHGTNSMGGVVGSMFPTLHIPSNSSSKNDPRGVNDDQDIDNPTANNLADYVTIIDYLQGLSPDSKATFIDINRAKGIDLSKRVGLIDKLKSNPKVEHGIGSDGNIYFKFRSKFDIRNQQDLKRVLRSVRTGIALVDIKDCYNGIADDVNTMLLCGDIIGMWNKEMKSLIVYSRGERFYTELSGTIVARPGFSEIATSASLVEEIKRGEAIKVDSDWYRVSSASVSASGKDEKSLKMFSVTVDKELTEKDLAMKVYSAPFTDSSLPLDDNYIGLVQYSGKCIRYGCSHDVSQLWHSTASTLKTFQGDNSMIDDNALSEKLISLGEVTRQSLDMSSAPKLQRKQVEKRKRSERQSTTMFNGDVGTNSHLRGTILEKHFIAERSKYIKQIPGKK